MKQWRPRTKKRYKTRSEANEFKVNKLDSTAPLITGPGGWHFHCETADCYHKGAFTATQHEYILMNELMKVNRHKHATGSAPAVYLPAVLFNSYFTPISERFKNRFFELFRLTCFFFLCWFLLLIFKIFFICFVVIPAPFWSFWEEFT